MQLCIVAKKKRKKPHSRIDRSSSSNGNSKKHQANRQITVAYSPSLVRLSFRKRTILSAMTHPDFRTSLYTSPPLLTHHISLSLFNSPLSLAPRFFRPAALIVLARRLYIDFSPPARKARNYFFLLYITLYVRWALVSAASALPVCVVLT